MPELAANMYVISAEIIDDNGDKLEKFRAIAYAGQLPGFSMAYNEHGLIFSINTLYPRIIQLNKTRKDIPFLSTKVLPCSVSYYRKVFNPLSSKNVPR